MREAVQSTDLWPYPDCCLSTIALSKQHIHELNIFLSKIIFHQRSHPSNLKSSSPFTTAPKPAPTNPGPTSTPPTHSSTYQPWTPPTHKNYPINSFPSPPPPIPPMTRMATPWKPNSVSASTKIIKPSPSKKCPNGRPWDNSPARSNSCWITI